MGDFFNWQYVWSFIPKILTAVPVTLGIVGVATIMGMGIGICFALIRLEKIPFFSQLIVVLVSFIRGTPILIQLFLVFYGLPVVLTSITGTSVNLDKLLFVYLTYGINTSAYFSEIFRTAIIQVPQAQKEAALSIGLTKGQVYRRIVLPQAVRSALPPTGTMIVALLQDTSLAFSLGIVDIIGKVKVLASVTYHSLEGYFIAAILFIVLSLALEQLFIRIDQRLNQTQKQKLMMPKPRFIGWPSFRRRGIEHEG